ncbi:probable salivary secreted peptide isoform X3 [Ctenocephalides felis]|uniref:probable salivary secreted peptide isoform X1 n=1 Tax=Ctenocephalides felis TaxID=7515 RepID=UPI000E6E434D|nr:probable salivary secreted peptide isoform X1 [Ctenocephalides felis]XP_026468715.1 probable salivary secreted peptide isoform X3 [Ctenocephalides felis]
MKAVIFLVAISIVQWANCDYHPPPYAFSQYRPGYSSVGQYYKPEIFGPNAISTNNSHHFQVGYPSYGNVLLYRQVQSKSGSFFRKVTREVSFPPVGSRNNRTISCVRALDQYVNGQGGYATLVNGGVGWKNVTLLLSSQTGKGFNFLVEIWGY